MVFQAFDAADYIADLVSLDFKGILISFLFFVSSEMGGGRRCIEGWCRTRSKNGADNPEARSPQNSRAITSLYFDIEPHQLPIIYSPDYNIAFWGFEKLHPFDSQKWGNVYCYLKESGVIAEGQCVEPREATAEDLMVVHPKSYLDKLTWSAFVARITEVPPVAMLPNSVVQRKVLRPFRLQTGGSVLAGKLALERGWAINIGGGFHHCSANSGGGFCAYADITLTIKFLFKHYETVKSAMIVDLDAHQGNGHERDFANNRCVYILDMYNGGIYPGDTAAKEAISRKVELRHNTGDEEYLNKLSVQLEGALNEFHPDILIYNAGTDILTGDCLGCLDISDQGIIMRDEVVFTMARARNIPIVMLTSGGYQKVTARIIANSVINLFNKGLIGP